jgi:hypothetical protein
MARGVNEYKQPSIVSGKSVNQILSMDVDVLNKLGKKDLQKITGRLVSAANKRIRRAKEKGVDSPAFAYIRDNGGKFSTRGKTLNQLRSEFVKAKNFLEAETSTVKGAEQFKAESISLLKDAGVNVSNENFDTVMKAVTNLMRNNKKVASRGMKYRMQEEAEILAKQGYTQEQIESELDAEINKLYEKMIDEYNIDGTQQFFDMGPSDNEDEEEEEEEET